MSSPLFKELEMYLLITESGTASTTKKLHIDDLSMCADGWLSVFRWKDDKYEELTAEEEPVDEDDVDFDGRPTYEQTWTEVR